MSEVQNLHLDFCRSAPNRSRRSLGRELQGDACSRLAAPVGLVGSPSSFCRSAQTAPGDRSAESFKAMLAAGSPRQSGSPALRLASAAPLKPLQGLPSLLCRLPGHNEVSRTEYRWSKASERTGSYSTQ